MWNVGEALGVIDQYQRRGWITKDQFEKAISGFAGETVRLIRIEALELLPVSSLELSETWSLIGKHHIYQGDALQLVACMRSQADKLVSADKSLLEVAEREGVASVNIEDSRKMSDLL
jgi:predicted nucleic acid-binding protein